MKKVLLIGSSYSSLPILFYLKKLNYKIYVCGIYKNDPAHLYANNSFYIDYSDKDNLLKLCEKEKIDYIVPSCNDYAYNSGSYVAEKLNFSGFDKHKTTLLLHTKSYFRRFLINNNMSSPMYYDNFKKITFPLLLKPILNFSGRGIKKINNHNDLKKINHNENNYIIEEFIDGELYSHSAFIRNKKIEKDFFVKEFCTTYPYQVDLSYTCSLDKTIIKNIREEINFLVKKLGLTDGLLHTQFILKDQKYYFIETMRRCPGDLYSELIKKSTNFNYIEHYVNPFLNRKDEFLFKKIKKFFLRYTITTNTVQNFKSINFKIKNFEFYPLKESGQIYKEAPYDKIGILFCKTNSYKKLKHKTNKLSKKFIKIKNYGEIYEKN